MLDFETLPHTSNPADTSQARDNVPGQTVRDEALTTTGPDPPSLIAQFPTEILIQIFEKTVSVDLVTDTWDERHVEIPPRAVGASGCPGFAQVCQQWRSIALDSPSLWRYICMTDPAKWITEQLLRAQTKPLTLWHFVESDTFVQGTDPFPRVAFSEPWRIEEIIICTNREHIFACKGLQQSYPMLRRVTLFSQARRETFAVRLSFNGYASILGGSAPHLRELCMFDCQPSHTSPVFQALTKLSMAFSRHYYSTKLSLNDILICLQGIPQLEEFYLNDKHSKALSRDHLSEWNAEVHLKRLRVIEIVGRHEICVILLYIDCPDICLARLDIDANFSNHDLAFHAICRLAAFIAGGCPTIESLRFDWKRTISEWSIELQGCGKQPRTLSFRFHSHYSPGHPDESLVHLCEVMPCERLDTLHVGGFFQLSESQWKRIFARTPGVTKVSIATYSQSFTDTLSSISTSSHGCHSLPLPSLQSIALQSCRLSRNSPPSSARYDSLRNAILTRLPCEGNALHQVDISDCRISKKTIEELRSTITVRWDGHRKGHPEFSGIQPDGW
ncbi:hypothetical protein HGRIS_011754 [Hohenbuehelia grisea]|uniref:F-box domain-containing protein n=1 Tax=Hohenbuehelia grisea TaxID=104357 RepID=A0ABR3JX24_9AGAR